MTLNIFAVIVASVIHGVVLGSLWYSPLLFGKQWQKLMNMDGKNSNDMKKGLFVKMIGMLIVSIITATIMSVVIRITGNQTLTNGMGVGILMWFGFATTAQFTNWAFSGKKKELFFIDTGYLFVGYIIMGAILGAWK